MTKKAEVYWNIRQKCWSLRQGGKVVGHPGYIILGDAKFSVQPAGNAKCRLEQRKNVHAFVRGELLGLSGGHVDSNNHLAEARQVSYNPYRDVTFVLEGYPIFAADIVWLYSDGKVYAL